MTDTEQEKDTNNVTPHRMAMRRILRRRGRAHKPRAAGSGNVKSFAEYNSVTLTPTGDTSSGAPWLYLFITLGILLLPAIMAFAFVVLSNGSFDAYAVASATGWAWQTFLYTLGFIAVGAVFALPVILIAAALDK